MDFQQKRVTQFKIKSLGDLRRDGRVTKGINPADFVHGPKEFDCLVNKWSRGELLGVVGDSGTGKSEVVLAMFKTILENNPDSCAVYVSLEMTDQKISERWTGICGDNTELADRLYVISRYDEDGKSRNVSMNWIKNELSKYNTVLEDIIVFAIDHVHCLGDNDASTLNSMMIKLKEMSVELHAFGIPMAQVNKGAGQKGEVPLDADAVLGCSQFKYICSDIIQIHRPILRFEEAADMSVLGWGYAKVREATKEDKARRGQNKLLLYDMDLRKLRKMTTNEYTNFKVYYNDLLEAKSAEDKSKAYAYDLTREIKGENGKVVVINEIWSGDRSKDDGL